MRPAAGSPSTGPEPPGRKDRTVRGTPSQAVWRPRGLVDGMDVDQDIVLIQFRPDLATFLKY